MIYHDRLAAALLSSAAGGRRSAVLLGAWALLGPGLLALGTALRSRWGQARKAKALEPVRTPPPPGRPEPEPECDPGLPVHCVLAASSATETRAGPDDAALRHINGAS